MKAITGATLIDGTGNTPVENAAVLIDGDSIQAVGAADSALVSQASEVLDASGMTLLPGLIDCHDHLDSFTYEMASRWGLADPRSQRHMRIASVLRQTFESGYMTVRDEGGLDAGFKHAVQEGLVPGPRLQVALGFITPTGGMADQEPVGPHAARLLGFQPASGASIAQGARGRRSLGEAGSSEACGAGRWIARILLGPIKLLGGNAASLPE